MQKSFYFLSWVFFFLFGPHLSTFPVFFFCYWLLFSLHCAQRRNSVGCLLCCMQTCFIAYCMSILQTAQCALQISLLHCHLTDAQNFLWLVISLAYASEHDWLVFLLFFLVLKLGTWACEASDLPLRYIPIPLFFLATFLYFIFYLLPLSTPECKILKSPTLVFQLHVCLLRAIRFGLIYFVNNGSPGHPCFPLQGSSSPSLTFTMCILSLTFVSSSL